MKNSKPCKWAYLPVVFSSAALLVTQVSASPGQQYQEAKQVGTANYEYVGGRTQVGGYITDDGAASVDINHVFSETENSSSSVGLWAGVDVDDGEGEGGVQLSHNWLVRDKSGNAHHVNKVFAAYDRTEDDHEKATAGYGQENENMFWEGHVSKGLSGNKKTTRVNNGRTVSNRAYDYGVGASIGKFIKSSNTRIRAGIDHEWGDEVAFDEKNAKDTTLSAGIEKFFQGTPHSVSLDVAASRKDGGTETPGFDDTDVTTSLGYHYDFGGASIYQPDQRYRRVRVEIPGKGIPARYARKPVYKRVPTYKTVPVYGKKTVKKPYKQLVKSTMELEGQTFFKLNSAKLIPSAKSRLNQIATQIRSNGYRGSIRITGNTCGLGDPVYDQRLSEKRAKSVRNYLIRKGFNPKHLVARGLGKGHPKYPNTPSQGFKNRRVDIEYVTERKSYQTGYRAEQQTVRTGTRRIATGFKNVPAGFKNVMIDSGVPGAPRVIWKTEAIKTSPAWIRRALHNNIKHDRNVNTYQTTVGSVISNNGPIAVNDVANVACSQPVSINVLDNDSDPDNNRLTVTDFTQPANGSVSRGENGQLIYKSDGNHCGQPDTFTYTISDGRGGVATATVTVNVGAAEVLNHAPDAVDDAETTKIDKPVTIDVLGNDTDPDGDALTIKGFTQGAHGAVTQGTNGLVYTPDAGFYGDDTFTYTISDGKGGTDTATVTITILPPETQNTAPVAVDDTAVTTCDAVTIKVLDNDYDPDDDVLSIIGVGKTHLGSAEISGNTIVYTPSKKCQKGVLGTDTFSYTIEDGNGHTATANVSVDIKGEGGCHEICTKAEPDDAYTQQDTSVKIDVLANDTGLGLEIYEVDQPAHGSAKIMGDSIKYTPAPGFTGTDSFWYGIKDSTGYDDAALIVVYVEKGCTAYSKCN